MTKRMQIVLYSIISIIVFSSVMGLRSYWRSTPEYAFRSIHEALENNDREVFYQFVDVEKISERLVDGFIEETIVKNSGQDQNVFEAFSALIAQGLVHQVKPNLINVLVDGINELIEDYGQESIPQEGSEVFEPIANNYGPNRFKDVRVVKHTCQKNSCSSVISMVHSEYGATIQVRLRLKMTEDGFLRVVDLANAREIVREIVQAEKDWKTIQNNLVREKFLMSAIWLSLEKQVTGADTKHDRKVFLGLKMKNLSNKSIASWSGDMVITDVSSKIIRLPIVAKRDDWKPGQEELFIFQYDISVYNMDHKDIWFLDMEESKMILDCKELIFTDGEKITYPYPELLG